MRVRVCCSLGLHRAREEEEGSHVAKGDDSDGDIGFVGVWIGVSGERSLGGNGGRWCE
jgi:hypothetical protein